MANLVIDHIFVKLGYQIYTHLTFMMTFINITIFMNVFKLGKKIEKQFLNFNTGFLIRLRFNSCSLIFASIVEKQLIT